MDIILYNPLSNKGKNKHIAEKLSKKHQKKGFNVDIKNLLDIHDVKSFLSACKEEDRIIIIGGDGTLNRIVNQIQGIDIKPSVFMYKAGTGNDFIRSVPVKHKLADIKPYIMNLPTVSVNDKHSLFLNGTGVGLDGLVCYKVNRSKQIKNKSNYFKNSIQSFFQYKPVTAYITVDGESFEANKVWFATCMHSKYFGGGMMLAPKIKRTDKVIELVVVKDVPRWLLLLIFPTIYFGWHRIFKSFVKFYRGKDIKVQLLVDTYMQIDGDEIYPVREYQVKAHE